MYGINFEFASKFITELSSPRINTVIKPIFVKRICKSKLIRITFRNDTDKYTIQSSLKLLKSASKPFNSIGITNDYTLDDQIIQKKLRREATELNSSDPSSIHLVRYNN